MRDDGLGAWDPSFLPGLALWLKADAISGLLDNERIVAWPDATGNDAIARQPSLANQPRYRVDALNGLPVARFTGNEWLTVASTLGIEAQPFSQIALWKPDGAGQAMMLWVNNSGLIVTDFDDDIGIFSGSALFNFNAHPFGQWHLIAGVHNGLAGSLTVDGGVSVTGSTGSGAPAGDLTIGAGIAGLDRLLSGDLAEIMITRTALTVAERQRLEGYLAHKWGLATSLPPAHPFRAAPPNFAYRVRIDEIEERVARPAERERWGRNVPAVVLEPRAGRRLGPCLRRGAAMGDIQTADAATAQFRGGLLANQRAIGGADHPGRSVATTGDLHRHLRARPGATDADRPVVQRDAADVVDAAGPHPRPQPRPDPGLVPQRCLGRGIVRSPAVGQIGRGGEATLASDGRIHLPLQRDEAVEALLQRGQIGTLPGSTQRWQTPCARSITALSVLCRGRFQTRPMPKPISHSANSGGRSAHEPQGVPLSMRSSPGSPHRANQPRSTSCTSRRSTRFQRPRGKTTAPSIPPVASSLAASQLARVPSARTICSVASSCQRAWGWWARGGPGDRGRGGGGPKPASRNQRRRVRSCGRGWSGKVSASSTRISPAPQPGWSRRRVRACSYTAG